MKIEYIFLEMYLFIQGYLAVHPLSCVRRKLRTKVFKNKVSIITESY